MVAICLLAGPVSAQDGYPRGEFFVGFSWINIGDGNRDNLFGFQVNITGNLHRNFGITADIGGQYRSVYGITLQGYEFMAGPCVTGRGEKASGFFHVLAGVEHLRAGGGSDTGFALGLGGGVDVKASDRLAVRVLQVDYIPNRFSSRWYHDVRVGVGLAVKFSQTEI